jgi:Holliday junction resolvase RusA-like endonuclease
MSAVRESMNEGSLPEVRFTILGEAVSKANSREAVFFGKGDSRRIAWIKSKKARDYERTASLQVPRLSTLITGPVFVRMTIWYASERPDLDESLVLDVMQGRVYANDRQVREKWIKHGIDRSNPRAEITVSPLVPQNVPLELE